MLLDSAAKYENLFHSIYDDALGKNRKRSQLVRPNRPNNRREENLIFLLAVRGFTTSERERLGRVRGA